MGLGFASQNETSGIREGSSFVPLVELYPYEARLAPCSGLTVTEEQ